MGEVLPLPSPGDVFVDTRGADRTLRVSYHEDRGAVVVSLWAGGLCRGSFRLAVGDVDRLVETLSTMRSSSPTREPATTGQQAAVDDLGDTPWPGLPHCGAA